MKDKDIIAWLQWIWDDSYVIDNDKLPNWAKINIKELIEEIKE